MENLYEWYRIVNINPSDDLIEKRELAVKELIVTLKDPKDSKLIIDCVAAVSYGLKKFFNQDSLIVQKTTDAIIKHQPAFPSKLSDNAIDLRACCGMALENLMKGKKKGDIPTKNAILASMTFISAMGFRPIKNEKYLEERLQNLLKTGHSILASAAEDIRSRPSIDWKKMDNLTADETIETFWEKFSADLKIYFNKIEKNFEADREELEVLWWLYNRNSETYHKPLTELQINSAALCIGTELGDKVLLPPIASIYSMIITAVSRDRTKKSLKERLSLTERVSHWDNNIWDLLAREDPKLHEIINEIPSLLPLTWICIRLQNSQGGTSWDDEFKRKSGIDPKTLYLPEELALQSFNERITLRIISSNLS